MIFIVLISTFVVVLIGIFLIAPSLKNNSHQSEVDIKLSNAENTNSYDKANERYLILKNSKQDGTFLSAKIRKG